MNIVAQDIELVLNDNNIDWKALHNASVLITGATGLIGSLLVKVLLTYKDKNNAPMRIHVMVRDSEKAERMLGNNVNYIVGDIRENMVVCDHVDYIIHCASVTASKYMITNPVETLLTSVKGTESILELAKGMGVKSIVYLSSMEVYGTTEETQNPITEEKMGYIDLHNPRSSYPEGKRVCECMCNAFYSEYGVPVKIARLAQTFGAGVPLSDNRVSMQFAKSALLKKDIVLHTAGRSVSNFCYTTDSLRGIFTILTKGESGQAYNVCNDVESRTISEIAQLVASQVTNGEIAVVFDISKGNQYGYASDTAMRLNSDKLKKIGWNPQISMYQAYNRLVDYLAENIKYLES